MTELVQLFGILSHDRDEGVRAIARRCLNSYEPFVLLRYAKLTARDLGCVSGAAERARMANDVERAAMLDRAVVTLRAALA